MASRSPDRRLAARNASVWCRPLTIRWRVRPCSRRCRGASPTAEPIIQAKTPRVLRLWLRSGADRTLCEHRYFAPSDLRTKIQFVCDGRWRNKWTSTSVGFIL